MKPPARGRIRDLAAGVRALMCLVLLPFMKGAAVGLCWAMQIAAGVSWDAATASETDLPGTRGPRRSMPTCGQNTTGVRQRFKPFPDIQSRGGNRSSSPSASTERGSSRARAALWSADRLPDAARDRLRRHLGSSVHDVTAAHRKLDEIVRLLARHRRLAGPGAVHSLGMTDPTAVGFVVFVLRTGPPLLLASPRLKAIRSPRLGRTPAWRVKANPADFSNSRDMGTGTTWLAVAVGGAVGCPWPHCFWLAAAMTMLTGPRFPWGTLLIKRRGLFVYRSGGGGHAHADARRHAPERTDLPHGRRLRRLIFHLPSRAVRASGSRCWNCATRSIPRRRWHTSLGLPKLLRLAAGRGGWALAAVA